jgi:hypothetical protein
MLSHVFESGLDARAPREERVRKSEQDLTRPVVHLEGRCQRPPVVGVSLEHQIEHHDPFSLTFPWGVLQKNQSAVGIKKDSAQTGEAVQPDLRCGEGQRGD